MLTFLLSRLGPQQIKYQPPTVATVVNYPTLPRSNVGRKNPSVLVSEG